MSGYPYHTATSFVRDPGRYAHDAFGHVAADDKGVRTACFRTIPHTGTDVSPKKVGDTSAPVVSPINGTIIEVGHDPEAGNYHIIKHRDYEEWWIGGHHSRFARVNGDVERGVTIAMMGMSGGAKGVHVHWTVATSLAAARRQITGYVNARNGRSVAAWAASMGLVDPWPLIEREWADEQRRIEGEKWHAGQAAREAEARARAEAEAAARREEEEMSAAAEGIKAVVRRESRPRLKRNAQTGEVMLIDVAAGMVETWHPRDRPEWKSELTRNNEAIVTELEVANMPDLDPEQWAIMRGLADSQLDRIAKRVADELTARGLA